MIRRQKGHLFSLSSLVFSFCLFVATSRESSHECTKKKEKIFEPAKAQETKKKTINPLLLGWKSNQPGDLIRVVKLLKDLPLRLTPRGCQGARLVRSLRSTRTSSPSCIASICQICKSWLNVWQIVNRSGLYRHRCLQTNMDFAAFVELYKIS